MDLDDTDDDNPTSSATPTRALLWQTVVASPHIKQILPVRVRDRPESDILVVRDNAIDAVEYDPNLETMRKVASTPPFPCSIRQVSESKIRSSVCP